MKEWTKPELVVLNISDTEHLYKEGFDVDGFWTDQKTGEIEYYMYSQPAPR